MKTLNYNIPPFKTVVWVSDDARNIWENRFNAINEKLIFSVLKSLAKGDLNSQYIIIEGWMYFKILELAPTFEITVSATFLGDENQKGPVCYEVLLQAKNATIDSVPSNCCLESSLAIRKEKRKENVWNTALQTESCILKEQEISLNSKASTSVFWQKMLVTLGHQHRCSFDCKNNKQEQQKSIELLAKYGHNEESLWLSDIYEWPVSWNVNHGICELRTPVLKIAYDTDTTANNYMVNIKGNAYPEEGAPGNRFPYQQRKFLRISDSKSFKAGLQHGS